MSDETVLTILKWLGFGDAIAFMFGVGALLLWLGIEYAMKVTRFTPRFIAWRRAEAENKRDRG